MKIVRILITCLFLTGCVTLSSAKKDLQQVDYADGISKKEAVTIAKASMINSRLNEDYQLWTANAYDNGHAYWRVVFSSLHFNRHECVLIIEKSTGDILAFYEAVNDKESALGANPAYSIQDWKRIRKFD